MLNKKQCRVILASGLMVGASMMFAGVAKAADNDNDTVQGQVLAIHEVNYTAPTTTTTLSSTGTTTMNFGTVNVQDNTASGWTLRVSSANQGALKQGTESLLYSTITATAGAGAPPPASSISLTGTSAVVAQPTTLACAATGGCDYTLSATIPSANASSAGVYTDTLTFTLAAP